MSATYKLSEGVLEAIMNGSTLVDPIVQILGSKKMISSMKDNERYRLLLSDGKFKVNIAMYTVKVFNEVVAHALELHSVIKLKRYMSNVIKNKDKRDTRVLLILDLELIVQGSDVGRVIGDPTFLTDSEAPTSQASTTSTNSAILLKSQNFEYSQNNFLQTQISPICSLNPFHNNWVIKARVVNKSNVRTWSNSRGEGKLFSVDLLDQSGEIRCTAFRELVDKFFQLLEVDKVYYINKCILQPVNRQFCTLKHEFEMTVTSETQIVESLNDNDRIPQLKYNLTSLDKIAVMEPGTVVDLIAVCKSVSDLQIFTSKSTNRDFKKKEILLVDQSKTGIALTLWGSEAEIFNAVDSPVILAKSVKICEFQSTKSVALTQGSQLKINPQISESYQLRAWYDSEGGETEIKNISLRNGATSQAQWMTFKEVHQLEPNQLEKGVYFQTLATVLFVHLERAVYKSCPSQECLKKVVDLENGMYRCGKCNREFPNFKYRLLVSMNLSDGSCNQWVTAFSSEAEKIIEKSAQEVGENMDTESDLIAKWFEDVQFKQFIVKCRAKLDNYNDEHKLKILIIGVREINFKEHNNYLIDMIGKFRGLFKNRM